MTETVTPPSFVSHSTVEIKQFNPINVGLGHSALSKQPVCMGNNADTNTTASFFLCDANACHASALLAKELVVCPD